MLNAYCATNMVITTCYRAYTFELLKWVGEEKRTRCFSQRGAWATLFFSAGSGGDALLKRVVSQLLLYHNLGTTLRKFNWQSMTICRNLYSNSENDMLITGDYITAQSRLKVKVQPVCKTSDNCTWCPLPNNLRLGNFSFFFSSFHIRLQLH